MLEIVALAAALQQQSSVHTVVAGETLSSIAGANWPAVCAANGIGNCNLIYVGQQIKLGSGGTAPAASTSSSGTSQADHEPDGDSDDPSGGSSAPSTSQADHEPDGDSDDPSGGSSGATSSSASMSSPSNLGSGSGGSGSFHVPGMPQSFTNCIAFRESTNGTNPAAHGNIFGIIPASGHNVSGMSVAQQEQVAGQIFASVGTAAWAPFDGC